MGMFKDSAKKEASSTEKSGLKNEMSHLEKLHKSNQEDGKELQHMMDDIHKRLKNLDHKTPVKKRTGSSEYSIADTQSMEDKLFLHNRITIRKRKKSKTFLKWLFNNNDL